MFSCQFCEIFTITFTYKTPPMAASEKMSESESEQIIQLNENQPSIVQSRNQTHNQNTKKYSFKLINIIQPYRRMMLKR